MTTEIAIIYNSKRGTTAKVAGEVAKKMSKNKVSLFNVEELPIDFNLIKYRLVILGTSIHAGTPGKKMKEFSEKNKDMLLLIKSGLFVCGMQNTKETQNTELVNAFPAELYKHATAKAFLGGEFLLMK